MQADFNGDVKSFTKHGTYFYGEYCNYDIVEILDEEEKAVTSVKYSLPKEFFIPIHSPEHSAAVQQWLFDNDVAEWCVSGKNVTNVHKSLLVVRKDGFVYYSNADSLNMDKVEFKQTIIV